MKISIDIKKKQLDALIYSLQNETPAITINKTIDKVYFYLFTDAFKKLLKKQIDKSDDFSNETFKMSFKYPDAAAIWNELGKIETDDSYRANVCLTIQMKIHQQLG